MSPDVIPGAGAAVPGPFCKPPSSLRDPLRCSGLHRPQTEAEVLEQSAQTLRIHLGALLSALGRSVRACPAVVRATFRQLFRRVRERFPGAQHEVRPLSVGPGGGKEAVLGAWVEPQAGAGGQAEARTAPKARGQPSPRSPAPRRTCRSSPSPASCACASCLPPSWRPSSSTCGSGTRTRAPAAPCCCWPRWVPAGPRPHGSVSPTGSRVARGTALDTGQRFVVVTRAHGRGGGSLRGRRLGPGACVCERGPFSPQIGLLFPGGPSLPATRLGPAYPGEPSPLKLA